MQVLCPPPIRPNNFDRFSARRREIFLEYWKNTEFGGLTIILITCSPPPNDIDPKSPLPPEKNKGYFWGSLIRQLLFCFLRCLEDRIRVGGRKTPLSSPKAFSQIFLLHAEYCPPKNDHFFLWGGGELKGLIWSKEIFYSCGRRFVVSRFGALSGLIIRSALLGYKFQFSPNLGHF